MRIGTPKPVDAALRTAVVVGLVAVACSDETPGSAAAPGESARFVGVADCARCHPDEARLWEGSDHDRAMDVASAETVEGDFGGAVLEHGGVADQFSREGGRFFVTTEGPDGQVGKFEITHTFGVEPLQQYLVPLEGGRVQVLGAAWDARPAEQGGQRWFHLYPEARAGDPLHWTGIEQNWNSRCAECHSTNLRVGYDVERDVFDTTWSEIDVSCEACHGPGSAHVAWAEDGARGGDPRLAVRLTDRDGGRWVPDPETGIARRSPARKDSAQVDACARCHSRRAPIAREYEFGRPLLDTHAPALLEDHLYHADGQILDEVYVWGSFVQSRMFAAGVTCSDCHDPHSLELRRGGGNAVCAGCHEPARFDTPAHHRHEMGSAGALCVECHMPARTYMQVDPRRDHSMRVPRPGLSAELGTPDACSGCHRDRSAAWAAEAIAAWDAPPRPGSDAVPRALHAGRAGGPGAADALLALARDGDAPAIARATAWSLLRDRLTPSALPALDAALRDPDPLVRRAAVGATLGLEPGARPARAEALLDDPIRGVRIEAARVLAAAPPGSVPPEAQPALEAGLREYTLSQMASADRPEAWLNLGVLGVERGRAAEAERAYRKAIARDPHFAPARVNLADLYRAQGREAEAEEVLREGLALEPDDAGALHALGLLLVRTGRQGEALAALERAARLAPGDVRYGYVHAVALHDAGEPDRAVAELEALHRGHPGSREVLAALAVYSRDAGDPEAARGWARKLVELAPGDPAAQAFLAELSAP